MNKHKSILFTLCYIIMVLLVIIITRQEDTNMITTYSSNDKIIIGNKMIKKTELERLINTISSTPKTEALAKRFGIEIEDAPEEVITSINNVNNSIININDVQNISEQNTTLVLKRIMEEAEYLYQSKSNFLHEALDCYLRNKYDKQFWIKIDEFIEKN